MHGNGRAYALRRLRDPIKGRPDIHARVLAGELSPHAGMLEAGFRRRSLLPSPRLREGSELCAPLCQLCGDARFTLGNPTRRPLSNLGQRRLV